MADSLVAQLLQQSIDQNEHVTDPVTGALIVRLLQRSIEQNERILEEHDHIKASLVAHTVSEEALVKGLIAAFPKKPDGNPDFEGHATFHTTLIQESRSRTAFYRDLRQELIKKGLWGFLMILVALVTYWWSGQMHGRLP